MIVHADEAWECGISVKVAYVGSVWYGCRGGRTQRRDAAGYDDDRLIGTWRGARSVDDVHMG
jgi:hypothetical protein